jgi:hypothetical protein
VSEPALAITPFEFEHSLGVVVAGATVLAGTLV